MKTWDAAIAAFRKLVATDGMPKPTEQAVIVRFQYGSTDLTNLYALEDKLGEVIGETGVGEFDGHEIAIDGAGGVLYMYGPDADKLYEAIKPALGSVDFIEGAKITLRYGAANASAREVVLNFTRGANP